MFKNDLNGVKRIDNYLHWHWLIEPKKRVCRDESEDKLKEKTVDY